MTPPISRHEPEGFVRLGWEESKEGDTVGGARLTTETGSLFGSSALSMILGSQQASPHWFSRVFSGVPARKRAGFIRNAGEPSFHDRYQKPGIGGRSLPTE